MSSGTADFSVSGNGGQISYDLNGNIQAMTHMGIAPGRSAPATVDDLRYTYSPLSNKLIQVVDQGTLGSLNGKLGDFFDASNGSNTSGISYAYDNNGNLTADQNKKIISLTGAPANSGISYNFLDKPTNIHVSGKGTIQFVYDADGSLLQKIFTPDEGNLVPSSTTTYINGFVYSAVTAIGESEFGPDNLQYIQFEEGRLRVMQAATVSSGPDLLTIAGNVDLPNGKTGAFDFFVKDHLGNTRMILTEESHSNLNVCTMETADGRDVTEAKFFGEVDESGTPTSSNEVNSTRVAIGTIPGQTSGAGWQSNTTAYVSKLGNLGVKMGPNALLKVMAGDQITSTVKYYYTANNVNSNQNLLGDLLLSLASALTGGNATSVIHQSAANISTALASAPDFTSIAQPSSSTGSGIAPQAGITVLFFDEQFSLVQQDGYSQTSVSQSGDGAEPLYSPTIKAPKNGYAFVFISNQSDQPVYFDDFQISQVHGNILEEDHYYSYGLKIAGISSQKLTTNDYEGELKNRFLFNGKEYLDDADLGWYDYGFRNYDAQIGRFVQLDPLTDNFPHWTPYQFAGNEPISNIDLDGLEPFDPNQAIGTTADGHFVYRSGTVPGIGATDGAVTLDNFYVFGPMKAPSLQKSFQTSMALSNVSISDNLADLALAKKALDNIRYAAGAYDRTIDEMNKNALSIGTKDISVLHEQEEKALEYKRDEFYDHIGRLPDGSLKLGSQLAENKTWQKFSENIATPMLNGAAIYDGAAIVGEAAGFGSIFRSGLTNSELVQRAGEMAERAIGGRGRFAGLEKHSYAENLLARYQAIYGNKGLLFEVQFGPNAFRESGRVDVLDQTNGIIYDWKFGYRGRTLQELNQMPQMLKYQRNFGLQTRVVRILPP